VRIALDEDPEGAAAKLRNALRITMEMQQSWRVDNEAFRGWRELFEKAGILTFQATGIDIGEARGFSISLQPLPVAVTNIKDAYRGRIFTLLHELAHIALNETGICDLEDNKHYNAHARIESYCNRVAGAVLFPQNQLLRMEIVRNHPRGKSAWRDEDIRDLSRFFGGSREALLVRLLTLGLTNERFYFQKRDEYRREYEKWRDERKGGFAPPHVVALSSAGPLFTSLVIENFNRERITASDVSDYLQIRLKHLPEIQRDYSGLTA